MSNRSRLTGRPRRTLARNQAARGLRRTTPVEKWKRQGVALDLASAAAAPELAPRLARMRAKHRRRRP